MDSSFFVCRADTNSTGLVCRIVCTILLTSTALFQLITIIDTIAHEQGGTLTNIDCRIGDEHVKFTCEFPVGTSTEALRVYARFVEKMSQKKSIYGI